MPSSDTSGVNKVQIHPSEETADISMAAKVDHEDARVQEIISDSRMRDILMDPKIQQLMTCLRSDTEKAQT